MSRSFEFDIQAFDCRIRVQAASQELCDILNRYIFPSLPRVHSAAPADIAISAVQTAENFEISINNRKVAVYPDPVSFVRASIKALDDAIVERLTSLRAVHSGAVLFGNTALLLPGSTHAGKSSLVAELLRRGATYLSDEYALIDSIGYIHAYPRPLLLRNGRPEQIPVLPDELNASFADGPAQATWIISLEYRPECSWDVKSVPQGEGVMILLRNTPHALEESPRMLDMFLRAIAGASCYSGTRGDAKDAAEHILKLVG
jgi:hypothetical protein